jgi:glycerophosphoryl diester phosphodiesterase
MKLIFKIQKAGERGRPASTRGTSSTRGRSPIEIIVKNNNKIYQKTIGNTDKILSTLDKLLKSAKLKIELIKDIKVISHKKAGLTSQRIVKAIKQALDF